MKDTKFVDYSSEVRMVESKLARGCLLVVAGFSLVVGFIGVFTPILPTTPFVLVAALCYARSSPRFYNWLMNHRWFGTALRDWVTKGRISRRSKFIAVSMLAVTLGTSIVFFVPILAVQLGLGVIGVLVVVYILSRPS